MARPATTGLIVGALVAFLAMVGLAILQRNGVVGSNDSNVVLLFFAGLAGASAMILARCLGRLFVVVDGPICTDLVGDR